MIQLNPKNKFIARFLQGGLFKPHSYSSFVRALYIPLKLVAQDNGMNDADSSRWATLATQQVAYESGYGTNAQSKNYNYGGLVGGRNYGSYQGFANAFYNNIKNRWPDALSARDTTLYVLRLHHNNGKGVYSETPVSTYLLGVAGTRNRVLSNIASIPISTPQLPITMQPLSTFPTELLDALQVRKPIILPIHGDN